MLTIQQVAEVAELSLETIRHHHKLATRARRTGTATARDLPAPASLVDGANVWDPAEIDAWLAERRKPIKRGGIPKSEMRKVLIAAKAANVDQVISIAERNLA